MKQMNICAKFCAVLSQKWVISRSRAFWITFMAHHLFNFLLLPKKGNNCITQIIFVSIDVWQSYILRKKLILDPWKFILVFKHILHAFVFFSISGCENSKEMEKEVNESSFLSAALNNPGTFGGENRGRWKFIQETRRRKKRKRERADFMCDTRSPYDSGRPRKPVLWYTKTTCPAGIQRRHVQPWDVMYRQPPKPWHVIHKATTGFKTLIEG